MESFLQQIANAIVRDLGILIPSLIGISLLFYELRIRRKLSEREFNLKQMEFNEDRDYREKRQEILDREFLQLTTISNPLADRICDSLQKDVRWASEALARANLGLHANTLFGQRLNHFRDEKEYIVETFLPILLTYCQSLIKQGKKVYLIMDSGTTLYPFFRRIGEQAVYNNELGNDWFNNLTVVTNSLSGIEVLMESGRVNPNYRYSPLAVNCLLLPGIPIPVYAAVTGEQTESSLREFHRSQKMAEACCFIGLTTGNWVRIRRTEPVCPVPLARGFGHKEYKQALVDVSDEVFVIAPLGKIFVDISEDEVNIALSFEEKLKDPDKTPYDHVRITGEKASNVKLVSTSRFDGRVLSNHSIRLKTLLSIKDFDVRDSQISLRNHSLIPFDKLPSNWFEEIEVEFPHPYTRQRKDFMETYFSVPLMARK